MNFITNWTRRKNFYLHVGTSKLGQGRRLENDQGILQILGTSLCFKVDLRSEYHQLRVHDEDIPKIGVRTVRTPPINWPLDFHNLAVRTLPINWPLDFRNLA